MTTPLNTSLDTPSTPPTNPSPQELLKGLQPKHSFGQNFLVDEHHQNRIATLAIACSKPLTGQKPLVVELGPGLGALTGRLLEQGAQVIAVERDRDLVPLLKKRFEQQTAARDDGATPQLTIVEDNALTWPLTVENGVTDGFALVGNLPYHHAADLCMRCVESLAEKPTAVLPRRIGGGLFLIQLEVAERIASGPGSKDYGVLSVLLQSRFTISLAHKVPRGAFWPVPDVDGGVIALRPHDRVDPALPFEQLRTVVRAAFQQRRKTLRNALLANIKDHDVDAALAAAAIDPKTRAEQVDVDGFVRLAKAMFQH